MKIDGEFAPAAWFDGLATGRTYVTNGPILDFELNGHVMGDSEAGSEFLELTYQSEGDHGTWFVVRAYGKTAAQQEAESLPVALPRVLPTSGYVAAVTAPIYISLDSQKTWKRDAVVALATGMKAELDGIANLTLETVGGFEEPWETAPVWTAIWVKQHALLVERIAQTKHQYDRLIELVQAR